MPIDFQPYDTATLLGIYREVPPPSNYWLNLLFPRVVTFDDEYIDFTKIEEGRKLAPFVAPTAQGRPIYSEGSRLDRFKPAYVKPKDPVNPSRVFKRLADEVATSGAQSPSQRHNAIVADIVRTHRAAIDRRQEWLAARAAIDGKVLIEDEDYPARLVDFGRDPGNTVILGAGARWSEATADIIGDINRWRAQVRRAKFGGPTNRLTVGSDVLDVMLKNAGVLKLLDTQVRGTNANLNVGIREGEYVEYIGTLGPGLELWVYSDFYELPDGSTAPFMNSKDVVLSGPNVQGVRAFGGIVDVRAQYVATDVFVKSWIAEDPSAMFIMSQSAPLMVPVNPNNTLRATVLA
ncbi:major capsid protein [Achromobacter phage vB_AchrS_AchV4]|uniref:Major capsid protein n=1 Tax=Achromobacter phage vB_AchrS_AchV4 TaxID=2796514 RepID=A0A7T3PGW0_9CAUD|nr:major head protein [Achromobacter phage vB_AchrS_AchV4]QPZ53252.1 major capsid protein [Achromobacter phage vB_AchrS_AchV4]